MKEDATRHKGCLPDNLVAKDGGRFRDSSNYLFWTDIGLRLGFLMVHRHFLKELKSAPEPSTTQFGGV